MRQAPLEYTIDIIKSQNPQIIGMKIYDDKQNEITADRITCMAAKKDVSISVANANMIISSILTKDILPNIPRYIKQVNHPIFGAPKTIKHIQNYKNNKTRNVEELLDGFPFADNISKSRALALLITPFIHIDGIIPIGIYLGNRERIGKDYLALLIRMLANDDSGELPPLKDDEETRKTLLALALSNEEFAHFSNNTGHMNSPSLEQAVTSRILKGRILGKTEVVHTQYNLITSLSGNTGWSLTPDLTYRSVIVVLHSDEDDIVQKEFKSSPAHQIELYREEYWNAIKQMYDNWVEKGKPKGKINNATFPEWANIIGGIMEANGYINPLTPSNAGTIQSLVDRDGEEWKNFIVHLYNLHQAVSIKEMIQIAENNDFFEYFDFTKHGYRTAFGKLVKKYCNRWFNEHRLIKEGTEMQGTNTAKQKYIVQTINEKKEDDYKKRSETNG